MSNRSVLGLADDPLWSSGRHDRLLSLSPFGFSVFVFELWVPLLRGGQVEISPGTEVDLTALRGWLTAHRSTAVHLTSGLFRVLAHEDPSCLAGVEEVLTGGDTISPTAVRAVLAACPGIVVRAMYGATEASVFVAHHPMTVPDDVTAPLPLGRPLDSVRAYVLDEAGRPAAEGELHLAGPRLAQRYVGRPDLTRDRFVADPFVPDGRMYRTGDLVRRGPGDVLEFTGRAGDLVKIRGFRVELGEVEAELSGCAGVADVAVVVRETATGERQLIAYLVAAGPDLDTAAVQRYAAQRMPAYMTPAAYVVMDRLPVTVHGKLDRASLPEPQRAAAGHRPPATARQRLLCGVFAEVLQVPVVGLDDSFFDLDGTSLSAIQLAERIRGAVGVEVTVADVFDAPTVAELDAVLEGITG